MTEVGEPILLYNANTHSYAIVKHKVAIRKKRRNKLNNTLNKNLISK